MGAVTKSLKIDDSVTAPDLNLQFFIYVLYLTLPAPYIPCVYNDVHFELELSGQLTDAGCPEKGWCAPPHQQKDQSVIYYP